MPLEALNDAKLSMRLLIRAANIDRELLADRSWQESMIHLNRFVKRYQEHQEKKTPEIESARVRHYISVEIPDAEPLIAQRSK